MNIYFLDKDPYISAKYHCDVHVKTQLLSLVQMTSTAHWISLFLLDKDSSNFKNSVEMKTYLERKFDESNPKRPPYKIVYPNNKFNMWLLDETKNYNWAIQHLEGLIKEFEIRYEKIHSSSQHFDWLKNNIPEYCKNTLDYTVNFLNGVPEAYICEDVIESYRDFYRLEKRGIALWERNSNKPEWF